MFALSYTRLDRVLDEVFFQESEKFERKCDKCKLTVDIKTILKTFEICRKNLLFPA